MLMLSLTKVKKIFMTLFATRYVSETTLGNRDVQNAITLP